MEKGKSRTDLLAAGRKKLQQFRKKKDHGGGGGSKSLGKVGKETEVPVLAESETSFEDPEVADDRGSRSELDYMEHYGILSSEQHEEQGSMGISSAIADGGVGIDEQRALGDGASGVEEPTLSDVDEANQIQICVDSGTIGSNCQISEGIADEANQRSDGLISDHIGDTILENDVNQEKNDFITSCVKEKENEERIAPLVGSSPEGNQLSLLVDVSREGNSSVVEHSEGISYEENSGKLLSNQDNSIINDENGNPIELQPSGLELVSTNNDAAKQERLELDLSDNNILKSFAEENLVNPSLCEDIHIGRDQSLLVHDTEGPQEQTMFVDNHLPANPLFGKIASGEIETLKCHLFEVNVEKNLLIVQLEEANEEVDEHLSHQAPMLLDSVKEAQQSKTLVDEQLLRCRSHLQGLAVEKEKYETSFVSLEEEVESVYSYLFTTHILKDFLQLQLVEESDAAAEACRKFSDELSELQNLAKENLESKSSVSEELAHCKSQLLSVLKNNEVLENQSFSMKAEIAELHDRVFYLQNRLDHSQEEFTSVSGKLAESLVSVENLQNEKADLIGSLNVLDYARKNTEEGLFIEQTVEENLHLKNSTDVYEAILEEFLHKQHELAALVSEAGCPSKIPVENLPIGDGTYKTLASVSSCSTDPLPDMMRHEKDDLFKKMDNTDGSDIYILLEGLKDNLKEAGEILSKLELSNLEVPPPASTKPGKRVVSKLIQAFESENQRDESDPGAISVDGESGVLFALREKISSVTLMLKRMELTVGKAQVFSLGSVQSTEICGRSKSECESQRQQNNYLLSKIDVIVGKHSAFKDRIDELEVHIGDISRNSEDKEGMLLESSELLLKEVTLLMQEKSSMSILLLKALEKLDGCTGLVSSSDQDFYSHIVASLEAAAEVILNLHEKIDAAFLEQKITEDSYAKLNEQLVGLQQSNDLFNKLVHKIQGDLRVLVSYACQETMEEELAINDDELVQTLASSCEIFVGMLRKSVDERTRLLDECNRLESDLLGKDHETAEFNRRCDDLSQKVEYVCSSIDGFESMILVQNNKIEEVNMECLALEKKLDILKMPGDDIAARENISDDQGAIKSNVTKVHNLFNPSMSKLEALVCSLVQKYEELVQEVQLSKHYLNELNMFEKIGSVTSTLPTLLAQQFLPNFIKLQHSQESLDSLISSNIQLETELLLFKQHLCTALEDRLATRTELRLKLSELDLSEQRLSSLREKLSIAVAKGKGLVVQRDSLKQSLLEKASELERCQQELAEKDTLLHEVEAKLKSCSEFERIEALESELSYIRNSATALRESFLLKDSVIQKIEEVLEDLDFPEHFHSGDIVEKVELLAGVASGNPLPDWDQKSSMAGSQTDSGFVVMDSWKDDLQTSSIQVSDEWKRKYEDMQNRFYSLAEHTDMLEQSLMERNSLLQKLEEALDGNVMPMQLKLMEPDDKIRWLGRSLSEVQQECISLKQTIENLEVSSDMLVADLEESRKKISELNAELLAVKSDRGFFSESLDRLRSECLNLTEKSVQDEIEKENLQRDFAVLKGKLDSMVKEKDQYDAEILKLYELVRVALDDNNDSSHNIPDGRQIECLYRLLETLIDKYASLSAKKSLSTFDEKDLISHNQNDLEQELISLRSELDETRNETIQVKDERSKYLEQCSSLKMELENMGNQIILLQEEKAPFSAKYQSLLLEFERACQEKVVLQEELSHEQQKSASVREKLNVAVRKGKGLVQHRDSLKQELEEMSSVIEHLKDEHINQIGFYESENLSLSTRLNETELLLQDSNQKLTEFVTCLNAIKVDDEIGHADPLQKVESIRKFINNLDSTVVSLENEAKKSKQSADLLLAELNEVHERFDVLQEELADAHDKMLVLSNERDVAISEKIDALSHLENLRGKIQANNLIKMINTMDKLSKGCFGLSSLLPILFARNVDLLYQFDIFLQSLLKQMSDGSVPQLPFLKSTDLQSINAIIEESRFSISPIDHRMLENPDQSWLDEHLPTVNNNLLECVQFYDDLNVNIQKHFISIDQQATHLWGTMLFIKEELVSYKNFSESQKKEKSELELMIRRKDSEVQTITRNMGLLFEACRNSVAYLENITKKLRTCLDSDERPSAKSFISLKSPYSAIGQLPLVDDGSLFSEDSIRTLVDSMTSKLKDLESMHEMSEGKEKELKIALLDLRQESQQKDIQSSRICSELVDQIKEAEAISQRYSIDLTSAKAQVDDLKKQVEYAENAKKLLELQVNELKAAATSSGSLQAKIKALERTLVEKDQEIESLMQALDEESQMEVLESRNIELEKLLLEKSRELEILEVSKSKAITKLSTTVTKFDELHDLSENLLAEVESLQTQLQGRDSEISFLRQELTRCTKDVLNAENFGKKYSSEFPKVLKWMHSTASLLGVHDVPLAEDEQNSQIFVYMEAIDKNIVNILAEMDDLRSDFLNKESLLQMEKVRTDELLRRVEVTEVALREKEAGESGLSPSPAGHSEIEQVRNKGTSSSPLPLARGGRKVNGDQISISINNEQEDNALDYDDEDDKAHGFKSLTMSKFIPRISRPVTDRIDSIWVSGDRLLMRQPTLRLGVLIYWIALHALLASVI